MPGIKKKKIVVASVLKPVDDTRMFEKIGQSLVDTGRFDVHIIGYPTQKILHVSEPRIHPSKYFNRISLSRVLQPLRILKTIISLKPDLLIITTHELLGISILIKAVRNCNVLYDVQENYYKNILYTHTSHSWIRPFLALYVRTKEWLCSPFINHFLLAEKVYEHEIKFVADKNIVLENKLKRPTEFFPKKSETDKLLHLLFSGTLADTTGIFSAIALAKKLYLIEPAIRLTIIGQCPQRITFQKIKKEIEGFNFIELIGGMELVPHRDIVKEIQQANFGIIAYPANRSTQDRTPTKLYEYLGCKLPILLIGNTLWTTICDAYSASISVDFTNPDTASVLQDMLSKTFYTTSPENVFWESEALTLIELIDRII